MSKGLRESVLDLIYPEFCLSCKKPNRYNQNNECRYLCPACYLSIPRHIPPFCKKCGRGLNNLKAILEGVCLDCLNKNHAFQCAWSVCKYEGLVKNLLHAWKYKQKLHYKIIFERLFVEYLNAFKILGDIDIIIPIPLHATRLREREYNQSYILASCLGRILQKPIPVDVLQRLRNTKPQKDLNEQDRRNNIRGCFTVKNSECLKSKSILLVDDVFTTGTTLSEAAQTLNKYKPKRIEVITLAS